MFLANKALGPWTLLNKNLEAASNEIIGTSADDYSVSLGGEDLIKVKTGDDTVYLSSSDVFVGRSIARNIITDERISVEGMTRFSSEIDGGEDVDIFYCQISTTGMPSSFTIATQAYTKASRRWMIVLEERQLHA